MTDAIYAKVGGLSVISQVTVIRMGPPGGGSGGGGAGAVTAATEVGIPAQLDALRTGGSPVRGLFITALDTGTTYRVDSEAGPYVLTDLRRPPYLALGGAESLEPLSVAGGLGITVYRDPQAQATFIWDDGNVADWDWAKPVFDSRGAVATIAMIVNNIGASGSLSLAQLRQFDADGYEITNHTFRHRQLQPLPAAEQDYEIGEGKRRLNALGFPARTFVAPGGKQDTVTRSIIRKYHRAAAVTYFDHQMETMPVRTYDLHRISVDGQTLAYLKGKVDEAKAANAWLLLTMHPWYAEYTTDAAAATKRAEVGELLDYLNAQGVPIRTFDDGLDHYGNLLDIGDSTGRFFRLGRNGGVSQNEPSLHVLAKQGTYTATTAPADWPSGRATTLAVTAPESVAQGLPEGVGGMLVTDRLGGFDSYAVQTWVVAGRNRTYTRRVSGGAWGAWSGRDGLRFESSTAYTALSVPNDFPEAAITVTAVSTPQAGTAGSGYPVQVGGTLLTRRGLASGGAGYTTQRYEVVSSTTAETWERRGKSDNTWTAWVQIGAGGGGGAAQVTWAASASVGSPSGLNALSLPDAFPATRIALLSVSGGYATTAANGLPVAVAGTLETRTFGQSAAGELSYVVQVYRTIDDRVYQRRGTSANAWTGWVLLTSPFRVTAAVDLPAVAPGGTHKLSVALAGVPSGATVLAVPQGAGFEDGLVVMPGYATAADTVQVRVFNVTATAIDAGARTWQFHVMP